MKRTINLAVILLNVIACFSQSNGTRKRIDSLSLQSRRKADMVLKNFDGLKAEKVLYSISNEQYYIVLKIGSSYKEYYFEIDSSGNVLTKRTLNHTKDSRTFFSKAFNLKSYSKKFITRVNNPSSVQGNPSYFVVRDIDGTRHGEYFLSTITMPIPIDKQVYKYLLTRLLQETSKSKGGP